MRWACLGSWVWTVLALQAAEEGAAAKPAEVAPLIERLGSEVYREREEATKELWEKGEKILPLLQDLAKSRDPEIAIRAKELIRKIDLGILPDSPPEIVDLVYRYEKGDPRQRRTVMEALKAKRAWRQMLRLHAMEKDAITQQLIEQVVEGVAIEAARDCLGNSPPDYASAYGYLRMGKSGLKEKIAEAVILKHEGLLDQERKKLQPGDAAGRYAMAVVAGDVKEAKRVAKQGGIAKGFERLSLLEGDPMPVIHSSTADEDEGEPIGIDEYRELVTRAWEEGMAPKDRVRSLRRVYEEEKKDEGEVVLPTLFLVGDYEYALAELVAQYPIAAFSFFSASERIDEALKVLSLDPANPDWETWIGDRFKVLIEDPDNEQYELVEISMALFFLEEHGMPEKVDELLLPRLAKLADKNQEAFYQVLSRLFTGVTGNSSTNLSRPLFQAAAKVAGDDELKWQRTIEELFGTHFSTMELWNWMGELEPKKTHAERFEWLRLIYGLKSDPEGKADAFLKRARAEILKLEPEKRLKRIAALLPVAARSKSPENYIQVADDLQAANGNSQQGSAARFARIYLGVLGRWDEAAERWLAYLKDQPSDVEARAFAAAALRLCGREQEAERYEKEAELMALGDLNLQIACGEAFAQAMDFARAKRWWERAALEADPASDGFSYAVDRLLEQAREDGDWGRAAAMIEFQAFEAMGYGGDTDSAFAFLKLRMDADTARAFSWMKRSRETALEILDGVHTADPMSGTLADYFYPGLRAFGFRKEHDRWFEQSWAKLDELRKRFPKADNLHNTMAWMGSRAQLRLEESAAYADIALSLKPNQAAYLDTRAEVAYAQKQYDEAVKWSERSIRSMPNDLLLLRQHARFLKKGVE